jgi:tripartite-type tricarboxylate transporter receptor subunit TctC
VTIALNLVALWKQEPRSRSRGRSDITRPDFATAWHAFLSGGQASRRLVATGIGTAAHLSGFMLTQRVGSSATHVPYKGAEALRDLLAGQVQFMFATIPSCIALIRAERLVPLAVSTAKRSRALPDVPTVAERGFPGFAAGSWAAFYAPRGTPEPVIALLNREINDILNTPSVQQQLLREGAEPMPMTPAQLGQFTRAEFEKWRTVVKASGATAE